MVIRRSSSICYCFPRFVAAWYGHGILLGQDGKINQTFNASGEKMQYVITFTLAAGDQNCKSNASLKVSAPDNSADFSLTRRYGKEPWEVYGYQIGSWGNGELVNLVFQSEAIDEDPDSTCWPVIDAVIVSTIGSLNQDKVNLLPNGGFELGPSFPEFTNEGVLLDPEPSLIESALQQWAILGTVKYINSKSHFITEGKYAIELVAGASSGIQTAKALSESSDYNLEFMLGDANDSCRGDLVVGVIAGMTGRNITIHSNGNGSAMKYTLAFKGSGTSPTPIIFQSYTTKQREDGLFCGPVIDGVVLRSSSRSSPSIEYRSHLVILLFLALSNLF